MDKKKRYICTNKNVHEVIWNRSSDNQSNLRITPFTSILSLVRVEWLKCWRCQDLLWVILELSGTKPHIWTHRHISPGFRSKQSAAGTDSLVQFSSGSTEYTGIFGQGTLQNRGDAWERAWNRMLESPVQCPAEVQNQPRAMWRFSTCFFWTQTRVLTQGPSQGA